MTKTLETSHVPAHGRTNGHGLYGRRPSPRRRNQRVLAPQTPAPTAVGCNCECRTLGTRGALTDGAQSATTQLIDTTRYTLCEVRRRLEKRARPAPAFGC